MTEISIIQHALTTERRGKVTNALISRIEALSKETITVFNPDDLRATLKTLKLIQRRDNKVKKRITKDAAGWFDALWTEPVGYNDVEVKTKDGQITEGYKDGSVWYKSVVSDDGEPFLLFDVEKWKPLD